MQNTIIASKLRRGGGLDSAGGLFHAFGLSRSAFTLAEVLITLGIIGVVAAMTLPSLVNNYKEKELVSRTKKLYSNVQNAVLLAQKDLGTVGDNTFLFDVSQTHAQTAHKLAKYFNGAKVCEASSQKGCSSYFYKIKYATAFSADGETIAVNSFNNYPRIILNDGSILIVSQNTACKRIHPDCVQDDTGSCIRDENGNTTPVQKTFSNCGTIFMDVNGTKLPNQFGADLYEILVNPEKVRAGSWKAYGGTSFQNILTGKDTLEYTKYTEGQKK